MSAFPGVAMGSLPTPGKETRTEDILDLPNIIAGSKHDLPP